MATYSTAQSIAFDQMLSFTGPVTVSLITTIYTVPADRYAFVTVVIQNTSSALEGEQDVFFEVDGVSVFPKMSPASAGIYGSDSRQIVEFQCGAGTAIKTRVTTGGKTGTYFAHIMQFKNMPS